MSFFSSYSEISSDLEITDYYFQTENKEANFSEWQTALPKCARLGQLFFGLLSFSAASHSRYALFYLSLNSFIVCTNLLSLGLKGINKINSKAGQFLTNPIIKYRLLRGTFLFKPVYTFIAEALDNSTFNSQNASYVNNFF